MIVEVKLKNWSKDELTKVDHNRSFSGKNNNHMKRGNRRIDCMDDLDYSIRSYSEDSFLTKGGDDNNT